MAASMSTARSRKARKPSFFLTKRDEDILRAVHFYRYISASDITRLFYAQSSLAHVRRILSRLSGGGDFQTGQYLYRFRLPSPTTGNSERVYTLGARGRDYLARDAGLPVDWYFRPDKAKHLSYSQLSHNLALTRFLVAAHVWCERKPELTLARIRTCYELAREAVALHVSRGVKSEAFPVIPDSWLLFEKQRDGKREHSYPILLEIDRGTQYQERFKRHIESRIEFVRSGAYKRLFETDAVLIAYATAGIPVHQRETRLHSMRTWTQEVLKRLRIEKWAAVFRFHALSLEDIYETALFEGKLWYRPDATEPEPLFGT